MKRDVIPTPIANHQKASAAVTAALGTLSYPITKQEAIAKVGDWKIPYSADMRLPLGHMLKGIPEDHFADVSQATAVVDKHWGRIAQNLEAIEKAERAQIGAAKRANNPANPKPKKR
jgi:hypothetical protein